MRSSGIGGDRCERVSYGRISKRLSLDSKRIELKQRLVTGLEDMGFVFGPSGVTPPSYPDKDSIRRMYVAERRRFVEEKLDLLQRLERRALPFFATGNEVAPDALLPRIELVESPLQADIFRYACLLWSIPVSPGYGRRMRFLIFDEANGKLIGVLGLSDPVYCLAVRDEWIGWDDQAKRLRLWHVMDAYVLGAVPPYNYLLGGKLIALLATSNEVREHFVTRYSGRASAILGLVREPHLMLLTTTSAMGRSSMLNRLKRDGEPIWESLGMTLGWGHFHLGNGYFKAMADFMREESPEVFASYKFGGGPSWKLRVIRSCLRELDMPSTALQHGVRREVFSAPLSSNWREFLRGQEETPEFHDRSSEDLTSFFVQRWLLPRAERDTRYKSVTHQSIQRQVRAET